MEKQQVEADIVGGYGRYRTLFGLYCGLFFLYGAVVNSLGPLFPYLSAAEGRQETQYSLLFIFRASGYLLGCTASKLLEHKLPHHRYLSLSALLLSLSCLLFTIIPSSLTFKCALMLVSGWGCAMANMFLHACIIGIYRLGRLDWYLIVGHGVYGVGGLVGPVLVYLFQFNCYLVLGLPLLLFIAVFLRVQSPQLQTNSPQANQPLLQPKPSPSPTLHPTTALLMCPIFTLAVGQQTIYSGWISSFSVLHLYTDKAHATIFSSLFWISITFFRFVLVYVKGSNRGKLLGMFGLGVLGAVGSLGVIEGVSAVGGMYGSAVVYGLACSVLYALGLALPQDYGIVLADGQSSNFILSSAFGEGILAVFAGQLMGIFGPDAMFYFLGFLSFAGIVNVLIVTRRMKKQVQEHQLKELQQMKQIKLICNASTATH